MAAIDVIDIGRGICAEGQKRLMDLINRVKIHAGRETVPDDPLEHHDGQARCASDPANSFLHVDGHYVSDNSDQAVAGVLLHEVWHIIACDEEPNNRWKHAHRNPPYTGYPWREQYTCPIHP